MTDPSITFETDVYPKFVEKKSILMNEGGQRIFVCILNQV